MADPRVTRWVVGLAALGCTAAAVALLVQIDPPSEDGTAEPEPWPWSTQEGFVPLEGSASEWRGAPDVVLTTAGAFTPEGEPLDAVTSGRSPDAGSTKAAPLGALPPSDEEHVPTCLNAASGEVAVAVDARVDSRALRELVRTTGEAGVGVLRLIGRSAGASPHLTARTVRIGPPGCHAGDSVVLHGTVGDAPPDTLTSTASAAVPLGDTARLEEIRLLADPVPVVLELGDGADAGVLAATLDRLPPERTAVVVVPEPVPVKPPAAAVPAGLARPPPGTVRLGDTDALPEELRPALAEALGRQLGPCNREAIGEGLTSQLGYTVRLVLRPDGSVAAGTKALDGGPPDGACVAAALLAISLPGFEAPGPVAVTASVTIPLSLGTIGLSGLSPRDCGGGVDRPAEDCTGGEAAPPGLAREVERFLYRTASNNSWSTSESADYVRAREIAVRVVNRAEERVVVRASYRHHRGGYRDTRGCGGPDWPCPIAPSGEGSHCIELAFVPDGRGFRLAVPACVPGLGRTDFRPRRVRVE